MYRFLLVYFRNIRNNPKIFLISISSFVVGVTAVMFIYLFIVKEFSNDKFHAKHNDIYRILENLGNAPARMSQTSYPMGNLLSKNHPEIQDYTRYLDFPYYTVKIEDTKFSNQKLTFVDRSFFKMFDFTLDVGNFNEIFKNPNTIIVDKETAIKYFDTINVVGKTLEAKYAGDNENKLLTIVGVLSDYPEESTLKPKMIADINNHQKEYANDYFSASPQLFLYIPNCDNISQLSEKLAYTYYNKLNEFRTKKFEIDRHRLNLQKLDDIYLHSSDVQDDFAKGDFILIWVLICVGVVVLIITFMNYIILTLGLRLKSQKQNQLHIVLGGSSAWLKKKFVTESVFYTICSFSLSLLLLPFVSKLVNRFSDYPYGLFSRSDLWILLSFFIILILFGVFTGFIQYYILAHRNKFQKKLISDTSRQSTFKFLVPFQLAVFVAAVTALIFITKQIHFIRNQDLGFDVENTLSVRIFEYNDINLFIQEFEKKTSVEYLSVGHSLFNSTPYLNDVIVDDSQVNVKSQCIWGDKNYIGAYKIKLLSGKNLSTDNKIQIEDFYQLPDNEIIEVLVNQEFVRKSGLKNPLGTIITIDHNGKNKGEIIGVVENVKNLPLYYPATPIVIAKGLSHTPYIIASVREGKMEEFKADVNTFLNKVKKESYFGYDIISYDFERWYKKEQFLMFLLLVFSIITLFILILGLIGISLFIAEGRTKEIGIRKVNGAKVSEILKMLNKDFVKWVAIAFVIATPAAWFAMHKWLENFAYKTNLSWWAFALAGFLALGIALLTVSIQSWKAANRNPVEALRYD